MKLLKKYTLILLFILFTGLGVIAFIQSKPSAKNERVYKAVQKISPYYLDKRFGGLTIKSKIDKEFKEKPTNMTLFKEFERLERVWGKKHLKVENSYLIILDNNLSQRAKLEIKNQEELNFITRYYGIK